MPNFATVAYVDTVVSREQANRAKDTANLGSIIADEIADRVAGDADLSERLDTAEAAIRALQTGPVVPPVPPIPPAPIPLTAGGWRLKAPFARGSIAVEWPSRLLWLAGASGVLIFRLPEIGQGDDPAVWPPLSPYETAPAWWPSEPNTYVNDLAYFRNKLWAVLRRDYHTEISSGTVTWYAADGEEIVHQLPRGPFSGFGKRLGKEPIIAGGGYVPGWVSYSATGPTLAELPASWDSVKVGMNYDFTDPPNWDMRAPRDPDTWPDWSEDWYIMKPRGTEQRWAADWIGGGAILTARGWEWHPYMGVGPQNYDWQQDEKRPPETSMPVNFALQAKTCRYVYDPVTFALKGWDQTPYGPILGRDFGPNGETMLCEGKAWASEMYREDPIVRILA